MPERNKVGLSGWNPAYCCRVSDNSLSAAVAEESCEVSDAGADVDEAVAAAVGREDIWNGGHADELVLLLRLHVLPEHVSQTLLQSRFVYLAIDVITYNNGHCQYRIVLVSMIKEALGFCTCFRQLIVGASNVMSITLNWMHQWWAVENKENRVKMMIKEGCVNTKG